MTRENEKKGKTVSLVNRDLAECKIRAEKNRAGRVQDEGKQILVPESGGYMVLMVADRTHMIVTRRDQSRDSRTLQAHDNYIFKGGTRNQKSKKSAEMKLKFFIIAGHPSRTCY